MQQANSSVPCIEEPEVFAPQAQPKEKQHNAGVTGPQSEEMAIRPAVTVARLACFFVLLLLMAFGLNALVNEGVERIKTSSFGAWNAAMQGRVNAEILISGSSRAAYHYDPRMIERATGRSAFNIGRVGSQTDLELAVLKAYLEHNRKPSLVIQNLDAFSFVPTQELLDPSMYVPYLKDKALYDALKKMDPEMVKSRYIPLYGYVAPDMNLTWLTGLRALAGWSPREDYFLGFSPRDRTWNGDFSRYKASNPHGVSFAIDPAGVQALEGIIQLCQKNDIQLLLVYSPEYSEMQAMTNNRAQIFDKFRALSERYHVPLWDYSGWQYNDNQNYFYNSQHLNATGAELFSSDFSARLKSYLDAGNTLRSSTPASREN